MLTSEALHGGDVSRMAEQLGCTPGDILDFSANINPRGLPQPARKVLSQPPEDLLRYPDWQRHPLRKALAARHQVSTESIVIGAGASALILDAFRATRPSRCLCFVPAFAEYRRACGATGAEYHSIRLRPEDNFRIDLADVTTALERVRPDLVVINNPHNPSGALVERSMMMELIQLTTPRSGNVLVDEAFIDYTPGHEVTQVAASMAGVIAIRSLTKFYGCPGLRVGYAVANPKLAADIESQMAAWPVGTRAMDVLHRAIGDTEFATETLAETGCERDRLVSGLNRLGLAPCPSSANYVLLRLPEHWPDAPVLKADLLIKHRILIRDCSSFDGLEPNRFVRIAVLNHHQNGCLLRALEEYA